jgi:DNA-binding NarL/FixJ family response regulator
VSPLRLLLADDHTLVRAGLRSLLETYPDVTIMAETGDGREAVQLAATQRPNIVLMDIAMPGLNGLEATARIVKEHPEVRVVILSMHANDEYVRQALHAGASGYLLKDAATAELELALRAVARGETYLSPAISRRVVEDYLAQGPARNDSPLQLLTARQREILQLVAEGKTTKQIAALLEVSVKTVETHRAQLMERLGIRDLAGLVRYALREGLVRPER